MKTDAYRTLLVEDDVQQASLLTRLLRHESGGRFEIKSVTSLSKARIILESDCIDLVILDLNLPDSFGIDTFYSLHDLKPDVPVVILSGTSDEEIAIGSLKKGAQDYLVKGRDDGRHLVRTLKYAVERKRTELEMHRLQALVCQERRMEAIGVLAGGIVHEINTPTQFVRANLEFISKAFETLQDVLRKSERFCEAGADDARRKVLIAELEASLGEARYKYFRDELKQTIAESIDGMERIRTMVRSMKSFMRNGDQPYVSYDVNQIITDAVNLSRNEWKYIAKMKLDLGDNLPAFLCCPQELCQAFLNIIINAVHAINARNGSDDCGMERGDIGIHSCCNNGSIEVHIADNGMGMSDDVKEHIFEPFFTTKDIGEGSGLGLSLVYSIVNKHGGKIWFESQLNKGSVFTVSLPSNSDTRKNVKIDAA